MEHATSDYGRIERALRRIESDPRRDVSLEEMAEASGLSVSHFRRLFTRWTGISPKRFVQSLTVAHARALLRDSRPILDAAFAAGLSGPGRLHDLMVGIEAMTPGEYARGGAGLEIRVRDFGTRFGRALAAATDRGVCALEFVDDPRAGREVLAAHWPGARMREDDDPALDLLERVLRPGRRPPVRGEIQLLLKGTNFQLQVWRALLRIPDGALIDYGQLAERIGRPGAGRAVGSAVGANPVSWVIPCHRVLRRHGELGGYRWGTSRKLAILGEELDCTLPE